MSLPIHRWFRYSAGFSSQWVENLVTEFKEKRKEKNIRVLDPFVGSGTTLLACEKIGIESIGFESHPFISRVAQSKLLWRTDTNNFKRIAYEVLERAKNLKGSSENYPSLIQKCYSQENIIKLDRLKLSLREFQSQSPEYDLIWLALVSILRHSSHAGTAQWQYVLPNKSKINVKDPEEAFFQQINLMVDDMEKMQIFANNPQGRLYNHDIREPFTSLEQTIDLIITSPPYANNYDYADATRLEMSFMGEIGGWGDLQNVVRPHLIRSCTQHVSKSKNETYNILKTDSLKPIYDEIFEVCMRLDKEKDYHGGKKNYHTMIALYFLDMAIVWKQLRNLCKKGSEVCFVIGDSAPYGIYVPVEKWLGELALAAGFKTYFFEKTRDRNVKWENRKHKVPLKEGRLWVKG